MRRTYLFERPKSSISGDYRRENSDNYYPTGLGRTGLDSSREMKWGSDRHRCLNLISSQGKFWLAGQWAVANRL